MTRALTTDFESPIRRAAAVNDCSSTTRAKINMSVTSWSEAGKIVLLEGQCDRGGPANASAPGAVHGTSTNGGPDEALVCHDALDRDLVSTSRPRGGHRRPRRSEAPRLVRRLGLPGDGALVHPPPGEGRHARSPRHPPP